MKSINITPTWEQTAKMLIVLLESGNNEGKKFAKSEIVRMGQIIDNITKKEDATV